VKRLLLASSGISALPVLLGGPADGLRVAFVPTPAGPEAEREPWVQADRRQLELLGCRLSTLELATADSDEVARALRGLDAVFITGGNAYLVLWHARRTGFAREASKLVEGGSLVYIGTSAGAILAGPDVEPAASPDGRGEAPALQSTTALQLVPFSVLPHDQEPERGALNAAVLEEHGRERFIPLRDDQAVVVRDDAHEIVASPAVE
jgi:dipeptidase E